jgi:hypothetical protein
VPEAPKHFTENSLFKNLIIAILAAILGGVLARIFAKDYVWEVGAIAFCIIGILRLLKNSKSVYRTIGISILTGIGIINALPFLNGQFQFAEKWTSGNTKLMLDFGIQESPILNVLLIGLATFLFWLDFRHNTDK